MTRREKLKARPLMFIVFSAAVVRNKAAFLLFYFTQKKHSCFCYSSTLLLNAGRLLPNEQTQKFLLAEESSEEISIYKHVLISSSTCSSPFTIHHLVEQRM